MAPSQVAPCAHVLSAGGSHLKVLHFFRNIVHGCMLPHTLFSTKILLIEDGSEDEITVSYSSAMSMVHDRSSIAAETRRVQARAGVAGAQHVIAFEAGRLAASCAPNDRVIVFTDNSALRSELEFHGVIFVSPLALTEHDLWWMRRERSLLRQRIEEEPRNFCSLMDDMPRVIHEVNLQSMLPPVDPIPQTPRQTKADAIPKTPRQTKADVIPQTQRQMQVNPAPSVVRQTGNDAIGEDSISQALLQTEEDPAPTVVRQTEEDVTVQPLRKTEEDSVSQALRQTQVDSAPTVVRQTDGDSISQAQRKTEECATPTLPQQTEEDATHALPQQAEEDATPQPLMQTEEDSDRTDEGGTQPKVDEPAPVLVVGIDPFASLMTIVETDEEFEERMRSKIAM